MAISDAAQFVYDHALPEAIDIQSAKGIILRYLAEQPRNVGIKVGDLIGAVCKQLATSAGPPPPGYLSVKPDLNVIRADLAAREAIQQLHGQGALIAHGQFAGNSGPGEQAISSKTAHSEGAIPDVSISYPEVRQAYSLATAYRGENYLLADGDIYLSQINMKSLPSRARRCLREAISTFQHGDYLSTSLNLGAASESLWLKLARIVEVKGYPGGTKLEGELLRPYPSIGVLTDVTWHLLESHADGELKQVFPTKGDRTAFMQQAAVLRERRNYAIHDDDADEDEALLRYNETGILLLAAIGYFNQLIGLLETLEVSTPQP